MKRNITVGPFTVSRLGYGYWRFSGSSVAEAQVKVEAALEAGITILDTAPICGFGKEGFGDAEARLGDLFAAQPGMRDQVTLVTKAGIHPPVPYDSSYANLMSSAEASPQWLKTDVIDPFLIHWPADFLASDAEAGRALSELVASGKVRAVGVSSYTPAMTRPLQAQFDVPVVATQPEFSAAHPAPPYDGTLDLAQELGMITMAWSPPVGGALALAWVLAHPANTLDLIGSQSPKRISASAAAFDVTMSQADWYAILEASLGERMP